jgi:glycerol-3-phosphate acyltransferase PlsY
MLAEMGMIVLAYGVGSVPIAYLAGRARGVDIRKRGSGNVGASNVWQSVSRALVVPVGLAQIGQGLAVPWVASLLGMDAWVQACAAVAAVIANDWNPWLRLTGGRGIGQTIGALLVLAPWGLAAFIVVSVAGVLIRAVPQGVAAALVVAAVAAALSGEPAAAVAGCVALTVIAMLKRLTANGPPEPAHRTADVWLNRLVLDRDIRDRDAWVRRNLDADARAERA